MAKNKKHIPQRPDDQYPKPDISADDAWKDMFSLLETELPKNPEGQNLLKKAANTSHYLVAKVIATAVLVAGLGYLVFEKNTNENPKSIDPIAQTNIQAADSVLDISHEKNIYKKPAETLLITTDSIHETENKTDTIQEKNNVGVIPNNVTVDIKDKKTIGVQTKSDKVKNIESNNDITPANSPTRNQRKGKSGKSEGRRNELVSNSEPASEPKNMTSKPGANLSRSDRFGGISPTKNMPKSSVSDEKGSPIYLVSTIKSPTINTANRLAILSRKPNHLIAMPLIIKDSTSTKRNRAFWNSLHAGLLWHAGIPFQSGTSMMTQANGKKQIWPILIPGIWISKEFNAKNAILLWAKMDNQHFSNKLIQKNDIRTSDSSGRYYEKFLLVNQSLQVGMQYNRKFADKFQLGLGLAYNHTSKALIRSKQTVYPDNRILSDTTISIQKSHFDWPLIKPSYISGRLEAVYSFGKIKTGVALTIPITSLTDSVKTRPVNGQIFLRWQIR